MNVNKLRIKDICLIGFCAAVIAVCALISIPMPYGVSMTLQTFAVPLAGIILGAKRGTVATVVYILLGAVGLPIFSNMTGGPGVVFGPTGGFILSFPALALAAGIGARGSGRGGDKSGSGSWGWYGSGNGRGNGNGSGCGNGRGNGSGRNRLRLVCWLLVGSAVNLSCGMLYFAFATGADIRTAFFACILPFIPTEIVKLAMAAILGGAVKTALVRGKVI